MFIPAHRILQALHNEVAKLQTQFADSNVDGSATMSMANGLHLLRNRETGGAAELQQQFDRLDAVLVQVRHALANTVPAISRDLDDIRTVLDEARRVQVLLKLEDAWREALARVQAMLVEVNAARSLPAAVKKVVLNVLVAWEAGDLAGQGAPGQDDETGETSVDISHANLTAYLRDRFADADLRVTSFQQLAGGFGKQTVLFDVESKALTGAFVMRRDIGSRPSVANDCHRIRDEYPVIKAVFERGFAAPEVLWLDTDHALLPGGDFVIMKRSPGKLPGNFFGARAAIPANLTTSLADVMAQLHTLPPLAELGDLTDSIRTERWNMSKGECTERYIRNWYELFLRSEHTPSPALTGIYGWLLDNVPNRKGRPSLLHGDIGFHNFLFDDDQLSVVLDWEFAHIGDPAEELGYVKVTVGSTIDWDHLMARYIAGGGEPVDEVTLRYFQVWAYARNATSANLISTLFANGHASDLKLAILPVMHIPQFLRGAQMLIDAA